MSSAVAPAPDDDVKITVDKAEDKKDDKDKKKTKKLGKKALKGGVEMAGECCEAGVESNDMCDAIPIVGPLCCVTLKFCFKCGVHKKLAKKAKKKVGDGSSSDSNSGSSSDADSEKDPPPSK